MDTTASDAVGAQMGICFSNEAYLLYNPTAILNEALLSRGGAPATPLTVT